MVVGRGGGGGGGRGGGGGGRGGGGRVGPVAEEGRGHVEREDGAEQQQNRLQVHDELGAGPGLTERLRPPSGQRHSGADVTPRFRFTLSQ